MAVDVSKGLIFFGGEVFGLFDPSRLLDALINDSEVPGRRSSALCE